MKTISEILAIINSKVEEHRHEIEATSEQLSKIKDWAAISKEGPKGIQKATQMLVLKDKILFHKACISCLSDLKDTIQDNKAY
jgi:hypothetical protein